MPATRGTTRGRGRGRGVSRSRGAQRRLEFPPAARAAPRGARSSQSRAVANLYNRPTFRRSVEDAEQALRDADAQLVATVDGMSVEEMRATILEMARTHPPLQWRFLGCRLHPSAPPSAGPPGPSVPDPPESPDWCVCGGCREMPEAADRICCNLSGHGGTCLRVDPECKLLTQTATVVAVGMLYHGERAATGPVNLDQTEALNRAMRWHAYRNFILWWWGSLGRGNRQRIPSCVLWAIRDAFPSPTGQYVGFRDVLQGL